MQTKTKNIRMETEFHDSCGVGFIAEIDGKPGKRALELAIEALKRMAHRGASDADEKTTDGAGLLLDIPQEYFRLVVEDELNIPALQKELGIAMVFTSRQEQRALGERLALHAERLGIEFLGTRPVPVNPAVLGAKAAETCPVIIQYFFSSTTCAGRQFETRLFLLRKAVEHDLAETCTATFICSLSSRTIVYKGMMKPGHLSRFYHDLNQPEFLVRFSIFHERFSTNTISSWSMAQPFRFLGHNGEINSIKGNRLWMQTRESAAVEQAFTDNAQYLRPFVSASGSDSFSLDNILEFLVFGGRSLFQSIMMLIPEPYRYDTDMPDELKDFYIFHENHIEPWDGPAALVFTDGETIGAKLDRNGLRPLRYTVTRDGLVVLASEAGVVDFHEENILLHHHMKSGENLALRLDGRGLVTNEEIISEVTREGFYSRLIRENLVALERGSAADEFGSFGLPPGGFDKRLRVAFGIDKEDLERLVIPMAETGTEVLGSMGDDTPIAIISRQYRKFYDYFKHHFAQVTNPPIDSIRERHVMSTFRYIGTECDLFSDEDVFTGAIRIESPVLSPREVERLKSMNERFPHAVIACTTEVEKDFAARLNEIKITCEQAIENGARLLFLSDEGLRPGYVVIPMLLVVSAVHHYLVQKKLRNRAALLSITGDATEDHHIACLVSLGASAVYPYMAYELIRESFDETDWISKMHNYRSAIEKGLLKIIGKMGISTISSFHGSMLINAIAISETMQREYFPSIKTSLGGMDIALLNEKMKYLSHKAFAEPAQLEESGRYRYRSQGEMHGFAPDIFKRIHNNAQQKAISITDKEPEPVYIRDLLSFRTSGTMAVEQTETAASIYKRFGLGAVSFGAISEEVHRMLARAATLMGIRSNTGEGGEQKDRFSPSNPLKDENCYTKQIASGRFGVTTAYLTAAREIQIKMGQGAKPGEGGQLPGEKVTLSIAHDRHTTPGVPLISPPPHHDIYSIEDLAELIYDLRQVNPRAVICVKLVSQYGIGIIASGVVKAGADVILISGNDGGTGASPLGSIKNTGLPWEIGLSEVHRVLHDNGLRGRVTLRVDGGLKEARDIVIAAMLGAEEFDFGTGALVALGCVMARQCHLNTCPVGIATQDKELRKRFKGKPEYLVNYLTRVAEDTRALLAGLGVYSLAEIIGRNDLLEDNPLYRQMISTRGIDLTGLTCAGSGKNYYIDTTIKKHVESSGQGTHIDQELINELLPVIMTHGRSIVSRVLKNTDRAVGTRLAGLISFLYGEGDFKGHIQYRLSGSAGQSLGAFLVDSIELRHSGFANDYVGKGMSGGLITIRFPRSIRKNLEGNTIIGNVALYGATGGELFVAGAAGERFAVRNSGAAAVVEGIGNHGCEYMTRGFVIVLGKVGRNFGAGMTGGLAFIYNASRDVERHLNSEYVRTDKLSLTDEDLILKYLVNHKFHTGSTIASAIVDAWETEKQNFQKIVPRAIDMIDLHTIYEEQFHKRFSEVFAR